MNNIVSQLFKYQRDKQDVENNLKNGRIDITGKYDSVNMPLFNEKDEITETTISNIFLEIEGDLVTPSVECGLLPGTFRAHMFAQEKATERVLSRESLKIAEKIYVGNSVRGLQEAILVD